MQIIDFFLSIENSGQSTTRIMCCVPLIATVVGLMLIVCVFMIDYTLKTMVVSRNVGPLMSYI